MEQQSVLGWLFEGLGLFYGILLPLVFFIGFVLSVIVLIRGKGPMPAVFLVLIVHLPFLIGGLGTLSSLAMNQFVIAQGGGTPDPGKLAESISLANVTMLVGLLLTLSTTVLF